MILVLQGWEYVRYVMIRRLTVSSYPVDMPVLVKDVLPESRTLVNLVPTVGKECPQLIVYTYDYKYCNHLLLLSFIKLLKIINIVYLQTRTTINNSYKPCI